MIPGEFFVEPGTLALNAGREKRTLTIANTGDRPIQVGSHYHFYETNAALRFRPRSGAWVSARYPGGHRGAFRARPGAHD